MKTRHPGIMLSALVASTIIAAALLPSCSSGGGSDSGGGSTTITHNWMWTSGSNIANQVGVYGTMGIASASNVPGARLGAVSWTDKSGNLWLFGGEGLGAYGGGLLNDLWKFDGTNWTWVSGITGAQGIYGTKGTASASNMPGGRAALVSWIDANGNLWLFGGTGSDSTSSVGTLNDLWKFDGTLWTWVSGTNVAEQAGTYGTKGVAAPSNVPGARDESVSWIDRSGNLWLFGGHGHDSAGTAGTLNDLWKFDGTLWTWVSGTNVAEQAGTYGTKGVAAPSNVPGARRAPVSWIDANGNLWLFGGTGSDSTGTEGTLNDLWKFDGTNWTWVGGSNLADQPGVYGTNGTASASNVPGARNCAVSWVDTSGNLWLFGGTGHDALGTADLLNDLWKFDGTNWTWVRGSNIVNQPGVYGTKGTASTSDVPGARCYAVSWIDTSGHLWLFGGVGYDSAGAKSYLNDLWRY